MEKNQFSPPREQERGRTDRERRTRLYVGGLPRECDRNEINSMFRKYGDIIEIDPHPHYAFVEFDQSRDAEDAIRQLDGTKYLHRILEVDFAKSRVRRPNFRRRLRDRSDFRHQDRRGSNRPRSEFFRSTPQSAEHQKKLQDHISKHMNSYYRTYYQAAALVAAGKDPKSVFESDATGAISALPKYQGEEANSWPPAPPAPAIPVYNNESQFDQNHQRQDDRRDDYFRRGDRYSRPERSERSEYSRYDRRDNRSYRAPRESSYRDLRDRDPRDRRLPIEYSSQSEERPTSHQHPDETKSHQVKSTSVHVSENQPNKSLSSPSSSA